MSSKVEQWITSPYCFCKELPWLVLTGLPAGRGYITAGWGWEDWAILAASLIALAAFIFLLFLLLCLLCPAGLCCRKSALCCAKDKVKDTDSKTAMGKSLAKADVKNNVSLSRLTAGQGVELKSPGGQHESSLTAVDLKLPRAWMDSQKGEQTDTTNHGIALGHGSMGTHKDGTTNHGVALGHGLFGTHKIDTTNHGIALGHGSLGTHKDGTTNHGVALGHGSFGTQKIDTTNHGIALGHGSLGTHKTWAKGVGHSSNSAAMFSRSGKTRHDRDLQKQVSNFPETSGSLGYNHYGSVQNKQVQRASDEDCLESSAKNDYYRNHSAATIMTPISSGKVRNATHDWERKAMMETRREEESVQTKHDGDNAEMARILDERLRLRKQQEEASLIATSHADITSSSNMALVKTSASTTSGAMSLSREDTPVVQCYTVTKKTTTTTYGDQEGDEETSVVTTTEKKWREGMSEIGEITVEAAASAGELLPSIGAPAAVLSDVTNVRTVKSLTQVEGAASDISRRYQYQHVLKDTL